jgi:cytochrome c
VVVTYAEPQDAAAPQTTIGLSPTAPNGSAGWYRQSVTVSVSADDGAGSGVAETRCTLDPATVPATFADLPAS